MNHKIKSVIVVSVLIGMMFTIGFLINTNEGITGAVVSESIMCYVNSDCNDHLDNTIDICKNPGTTESFCINEEK